LETVPGGGEVELFANAVFDFFQFRGKEFDGVAADGTDHVVMVTPVKAVFIAGDAVVEFNHGGQAALSKELERAIDGGVSDGGIVSLDQTVQFFCGKVVAGGEKDAQNCIALRTVLQAKPGKMVAENLFRVFKHFVRHAGPIIYALLWHFFRDCLAYQGL
jgi:hypothetical protein